MSDEQRASSDVLRHRAPAGPWAPVVLDSPHSGRRYPDDFRPVAPMAVLRAGEDSFVDELFWNPVAGATMLAAEFARTYIDPNRSLLDIDPLLIDSAWPGEMEPSEKSAVGKGLVWRSAPGNVDIYDRKLSVAEVRARIEHYWKPYRAALDSTLEVAWQRAGAVWHINCHSMPSVWPAGVPGAGSPVEADFLLGNRDGATCDAAMVEIVSDSLRSHGFSVAVNDRFKGVDIVARCGDPGRRRNSLQIEVVRDRYMDELSFEKAAGFSPVRSALGAMVETLCEHARAATAS